MLRHVPWLCAALLLLAGVVSGAEKTKTKTFTCDSPEVQEMVKDMGAECNPSGWTAVSKLPGVRVVVFDPISRSFLFTTCSEATRNEELLDRRRLALPTQKIRLLVLPYNPADGDLQIETVNGTGTEFESTSSTGTASAASTTAPSASSTGGGETKPKATDQPPPEDKPVIANGQKLANKLSETARGANQATPIIDPQALSMVQSLQSGFSLNTQIGLAEDLRKSGHATDPQILLKLITTLFQSYGQQVDNTRKTLSALSNGTECVDRHVADLPRSLGVALTQARGWTPARDTRLCAVIAETLNRQKVIGGDFYQACVIAGDKTTGQASFEQNVQSLMVKKGEVEAQLGSLELALIEIDSEVGLMEAIGAGKQLDDDWKAQADAFSQQLEKNQKYLQGLRAELATAVKTIDGARQKQDLFRAGQASQAASLHRENYPPLENGHSLTIKVNRIQDGARSNQPIATQEIRSAPAYNVRFGTGLVVSELKDPTFKLGPVAASSPSSQAGQSTTQRILFDDEGGGRVLPMILVHHSWGRRSPLLSPAPFERFTPTFSLGIPVAKADPLTQVLFGLDWELTPGIELNVGIHYGKVNSLTGGYTVGNPLNGIELTSIQKKTFASAVYFGIVVNSDTFKTLMDSQK